ncbi:MAG: sulfotransferase [Deltaproteobacteria bacterium]
MASDGIRIDDLAAPRLPRPLAVGNRLLSPFARRLFPLDEEGLLAAARHQTKLDDFGSARFREPLHALLQSLESEAHLHALGRFCVRRLILQLLMTRLRMVDLLRRHPEIEDQTLEAPIIVVGLPRTGTTLLHNLLSQHPDLRTLPYWESLEPLPASEALEPDLDADARRNRCTQAISMLHRVMPHFAAMHEMETELPHEEIQLLAVDFSTMLFESSYDIPGYRRWYMTTDQTPAYAMMRRLLQVLQWLRGGERWLLKSPQHLEQLPVLFNIFPDASVVQTHRDPLRVVLSMATMAAYTARMNSSRVEPHRIGRAWLDRIESMLHTVVRDRAAVPAERVMDVHFDEYMANNIGMAERVLGFAGESMTPQARQQMEAFRTANPRGKYASIQYCLEDLGLSEKLIRDRLGFYQDHFGVPDE